jgi:carboxyl-terminal processing protease
MKKLLYLTVILLTGTLSACTKNNSGTVTYLNQIQDSVYYYEKEDYLWNDAIPSYNAFDPRSYSGSNDLAALSGEITAISQLKINPSTGKPYEYYPPSPGTAKYSFIDNGTTTGLLAGQNDDFGFEPLYIADDDLRVKLVYPGSPADMAGVKRGYQIMSINGNSDLSSDEGGNVNTVVNAVYYSTSITMTLLKPDNTTINVTFNTAVYTVNPVLTYQVYNEGGGHVVGYIVFNSFTDITNAQPVLDQAFNYFIAQGVNDLVFDLRYNGGGEQTTAAYIDNLIVPAAKSGTVMYTDFYTENLQTGNAPLFYKKFGLSASNFAPINNQVSFSKQLSLSLNRVFFIVTGATASSAELTINNLRPELTVNLIGDTTYGKPVGEIPIPMGTGSYIIYSPQFYVENSASQGNYYSGFAPNSADFPGLLAADDVTKDFGDTTEMLLSDALTFIKTGSYAIKRPQIQSLNNGKQSFSIWQQKIMTRKMDHHKEKLMVARVGKGKS